MNGEVIEENGNIGMIPFLFQGQYYDRETELAYNRFRYYSPQMGMYVSQDPIGITGGILNLYGYVNDTNAWTDAFGKEATLYNIDKHGQQPRPRGNLQSHHIIQDEWAKNQGYVNYSSSDAPSILLDATPGNNMHAIITNRQNQRRDARIAAGQGKWSSSLEDELRYARADLLAAGVPEEIVDQAIHRARNYYNSL